RRARGQPARLLAAFRHLPRLRRRGTELARDEAAVSLHWRKALSRGADAVKALAGALLTLAACAHGENKAPPSAAAKPQEGMQVQDAVHGARYELPPGTDPWQVT